MDDGELLAYLRGVATPSGFRFGPVRGLQPEAGHRALDELAGLGQAEDPAVPACPAPVSGQSTYALVRGDWSALPRVAFFAACRAGLIALGIAGARRLIDGPGAKPDPHLLRDSVAGAIGIEAFVALWALLKGRR